MTCPPHDFKIASTSRNNWLGSPYDRCTKCGLVRGATQKFGSEPPEITAAKAKMRKARK
jgi:hypothetical protein